jgi:hypothetical protein
VSNITLIISFEVKLPSACSFIVDGLRFVVDVHTTCFGLHGHLQVCMIFHYLFLKESASLLFVAA